MARFDVYPHPDAALRKTTPFLLDVQNSYIDRVASRIVIPLRHAKNFGPCMDDLNPVFEIAGVSTVLDTAAMAAFPAAGLKTPVAHLGTQSNRIVAALDTLFGSF